MILVLAEAGKNIRIATDGKARSGRHCGKLFVQIDRDFFVHFDMIRETLFKTREQHNHGFRLRGHEVKRIETFTDAVFAFAVTLLIVSLEVPKSFDELLISMRGFFAFAICFTALMLVWHEQHVYFRRYALDDIRTVVLNSILIFIVLFYVYPLKFLFSIVFGATIYGKGKSPFWIRDDDIPRLMVIYGLGYIAIYAVFSLMYLHAIRKKLELELSPTELFDTRTNLYAKLVTMFVGCIAIILAVVVPVGFSGYTGFAYMILGPFMWLLHSRRAKQRRRIQA